MSRVVRLLATLCLLVLLSACDLVFPPTDLTPVATFESTSPPDPGHQMDRAINQLNQAAMASALTRGQTTVIQIGDGAPTPTADGPTDTDLVLRPFFSREALEAATTTGYGVYARSGIPDTVLGDIDFSTQFVILLARPVSPINLPSTADIYRGDGSVTYLDSLQQEHGFDDTLHIRFQPGQLGRSPMLPRGWNVKVFVIERAQFKTLEIVTADANYTHAIP